VLAWTACKPKEVVITPEDTIAKEDAVIKGLQEKITDRQKEIDSLESERRKESDKLAAEQRQKRNDAIKKYEEFLGKYPISPYTPDVLIALGELYLERSDEENIAALEVFQTKVEDAMAKGEVVDVPEPMPHYEKTIAAYQQIALKYKDFPYADVAYYGLGYCLRAQGEEKDAAQTFYKLTQLYPNSKFVPEAYFRIGEYFFDQYEFDKAVKYYALVPADNPNFYDKALYKMGWAYYNQGDIGVSSSEYQKAIDAFTKLIETTESKSVLTDEAMEFTAISLTEWSNDPNDETAVAKAVSHYEENFRGGKEREYSPEVLQKLGDVYLYKQDKLRPAATAYEAVLANYPNYDKAPQVLDSLVECYLRQEDYAGAHATRVRIVDGYGPASEWYAKQDNLDVKHKALQRWENALYEVAIYFNLQADKLGTAKPEAAAKMYADAIARYNQYLASFPTNAKAYHVNFYLAESYFAVNDFANAGDQYQKTALGYAKGTKVDEKGATVPDDHYQIDKWAEKFTQEDALYNAIVAYNEIFGKDKEAAKATEPPKTEAPAAGAATEPGVEPLGPIVRPVKPLTLDEANLIRACNAFVDRYGSSPRVATVLSTAGDVYFYVDDYDRAREEYKKLVDDYAAPPDPKTKTEHDQLYVHAAEGIANSYYNEAIFFEKAGDYQSAEDKYAFAKQWYSRTEKEAKDRGVMDTVERAKTIKGLAGMKAAEMKGAGVSVEEIAPPEVITAPPTEEGTEDFTVLYPPMAPIEASAFAAKSAEAQEYERNAAENQGNDVGRISMGKAADTYYKIRDWDNAARVYMQYTKAYPQAEDVKMAYEKSAECYERKEDWAAAGKVYIEIAEHPKFKGTPLGRDSLFRAGLMYEQQKDWSRVSDTFGEYIKDYPDEAKPLLEATYRQARAQEHLGATKEALENHKKVVGVYKYSLKQGFDMAGTEKFVADSEFKMVDVDFPDYDKVQLVLPQKVMEANLKKKIELSQNLIAGYADIASLGIPKWAVAAHCRMGDVYVSFRDTLRNAEIPEELKPEYWEALPDDDQRKPLLEEAYNTYTEKLEEQAMPLEDKAIAEYTEAYNLAEANTIQSEWSRKAYDQLLKIRPTDIVKYEDVGQTGLKSDTSWVVSNVPPEDEEWLGEKFDDGGWGSATESAWREKDLLKVTADVPGKVATIWGGPADETIYLRKKVSFTYDPGYYDAVVQTIGSYKLYVNGTLLGQSDPLAKDGWTKPDSYDASPALHVGDNVICIEATRVRDDSFGVRFALVPEGGFPEDRPPEPSIEETGVPGETPGGVSPEEGDFTGEGGEVAPAEGGEVTPPAEGGEVTPPAEGGEVTPPAEGGEVTPPAEGGEVTPAEGGEVTPAAEGETPTDEGALPAPGEGGSESGDAGSTSGTIDFESTGVTPPPGAGGEAGTEEPAPGGEEF
jgi:tetratricopeptide (TPR) repeat protein